MKRNALYRAMMGLGVLTLMMLTANALYAQTPKPADTMIPALDLQDTSIGDALKMLFKMKPGANFVLEPGADGVVRRLTLTNVTFTQALKTVLRASGLTYQEDSGVYIIKPKAQPIVDTAAAQLQMPMQDPTTAVTEEKIITEKIPLLYTDVFDMANLLNGQAGSRASQMSGNSQNGGGSFGGGSMGGGSSFGGSSMGSGGSYGGSSMGGGSSYGGSSGGYSGGFRR